MQNTRTEELRDTTRTLMNLNLMNFSIHYKMNNQMNVQTKDNLDEYQDEDEMDIKPCQKLKKVENNSISPK